MTTVMYENVADDVTNKGYVAISHVWGDQQMYSADELGINSGVNWEIPLSNPNKIRRLVDAMNYHEKEYCWFDVLCMPQDNQGEINKEIPFMGDYYGGADMTLVLSTVSYNTSDDFTRWQDIVSSAMLTQRNLSPQEDEWIFGESRNLLDFHTDQWFTRVWTLQEAILSKKVILVGTNAIYISLTNVITKLSYLSSKNVLYASGLFADSPFLLDMIVVSKEYRDGTLDLARVLSANSHRNCYKIHDRFYGVFGILGYRNFAVNYSTNIGALNKQIVQYSYSKGDISWIAVGGDSGTFIQPMYEPFLYVGILWKEIVPSIVFRDTLYMEVTAFATVLCCEKFIGSHTDLEQVVSWTVHTFRGWRFSHAQILATMMGYVDMPTGVIQVGSNILDAISRGITLGNMADELDMTEFTHRYFGYVMSRITSLSGIYDMVTIVKTDNYPLIVSGNADIGDTIVVANVYDGVRRRLGIVCNSDKRKGVCLVPRICKLDQPICHKFLL